MGYKDSKNEIIELIEAKYPCIQVVSEDDIPVIKTFVKIAENKMTDINYDVITWNIATGVVCEYGEYDKKGFLTTPDKPLEEKVTKLFEFIKTYKKDAIFILQDFDFIIKEHKNFSFNLKDAVQSITLPLEQGENLKRHTFSSKSSLKHIVISSATQYIPAELDKLVNLVHFGMPGREEIETVIDKVAEIANQSISKEERENIISASFGLTETELTNALFKSIASSDNKKINSKSLSSLKAQIIRKGGLVDFVNTDVGGINNIGGMNNLKDWIEKRKIAFNEEKRLARKLPYPKGILLTGIQGAGKSHMVKAIGEHLGMPLIRFDIGKVKGKYVGESEENMRKAISLAEAVSPCILWIDEIEKAFPDPRNINTHEVSKGLLGYFLTWMQEKKKPVFVVATANNIDTLPPELLRKGRFDDLFWVDLPKDEERKQIFEIHLKKIDIDPSEMDLTEVVEKSNGYSGAEIEAAIHEANFHSAYDDKPLDTEYISAELSKTTPISVVRAESIKEMREWATKNKVRPAS